MGGGQWKHVYLEQLKGVPAWEGNFWPRYKELSGGEGVQKRGVQAGAPPLARTRGEDAHTPWHTPARKDHAFRLPPNQTKPVEGLHCSAGLAGRGDKSLLSDQGREQSGDSPCKPPPRQEGSASTQPVFGGQRVQQPGVWLSWGGSHPPTTACQPRTPECFSIGPESPTKLHF